MRRISSRGKFGIGVAAAAVLVALAVPLGPSAHAAPMAASSVTYHGTAGSVTRGVKSTTVPKGVTLNTTEISCENVTNLPAVNCSGLLGGDDAANKIGSSGSSSSKPLRKAPAAHTAFNGGTTTPSATSAPRVNGMTLTASEGAIKHNFNGVSNDDNATVNGFVLTPPDQGLCVGPAGPLESVFSLGVSGSTTVVVEPVNEAYDIYATNGTILFGPDNLADLFSDGGADGDVSCLYDPSTQTYFFSEIGVLQSGPDVDNVATDLAVINKNGYAAYQIDTSVGGACFPDFPHQGFDKNAWYLTVNQFDCGPASQGFYAGAMVWGVAKADLVNEVASPHALVFGPLLLGGNPILALAPAFGDATGTEYMTNSFPYDQFGNNNSIANTLGFWHVGNDQDITSNPSKVDLDGQVISSETYAFPQPAASTGDGSTFVNGAGFTITNEMFLNPDDDRMDQLEAMNTPSGLRLYTSLDSAVNIAGDTSARDGAAWFVINPSQSKVSSQGFIAAKGTYLLYPSFVRGSTGTKVIDFSMTSTSINPSTGYVYMKDTSTSFSSIQTSATGSGPHYSFSDAPPFNRPRWGDYSAAALDPNSGSIWVADEYVPPTSTNGFDNWGTDVWNVYGS